MAEEGEVLVRRRRWPRVLAVIAVLVGLVVLGLWLARKPIARGQVDGFLAKAGVPARYTISDLGPGRQRLTDVVLGDPTRPDLVANWLETRTAWGLHGPYLASVRGGRVRVRARWADGRLSLGSINRLLPKGEGGKPFALPALAVDVEDLRARVETPWGLIGAKLAGRGRLDGGFAGQVAATAPRLAVGACVVDRAVAVMRVESRRDGPAARGPLQAATLACPGVAVAAPRLTVDMASDSALLNWRGKAALAAAAVTAPGVAGRALAATATFRSVPKDQRFWAVNGEIDARLGSFATASASGGATRLVGWLGYGPSSSGYGVAGSGLPNAPRPGMRLTVAGLRVSPALLRRAVPTATLAGTPLAPLAARIEQAIRAAGDSIDLDADVQPEFYGSEQGGSLYRLDARAASGARVALAAGSEITWYRAVRLDKQGRPQPGEYVTGTTVHGSAELGGGGFPALRITLRQLASNMPVDAAIVMQPYRVDAASLALTGASLRWTPGSNAIAARARAALSGPLGDGRVEGLAVPIDAAWRGGVLTLGPACAPVRWDRIAAAGLVLDAGGLTLCPEGSALARVADGKVAGGARVAAARLTGRLGATPLTLAAADARVRLADRGFALRQVEARLGPPARQTRLSLGALDGRIDAGGLTGRFAETGGQIGNVPLTLSGAAGDWRFAGGALALDGAMTVADTAAPAQFQPMAARDVTLRLAQGQIAARGVLHEPVTGTKVADVAIRHDLAAGRGTADLTVPGLSFVKGFQPDQLTRLTFGVIAEVRGTVNGGAHLAWTPAGVTSAGVFRTDGTDLAAAFGPVAGIAGEIRFTDLLALQSAPGQRFTVKSINPGVPVTDGVITFQTLPGTRIDVAGGRWPFAGGELTLAPTLLDFSAAAQRRMTFRVTGAAADQFLQSFDFKNLDATGTFDGVLPMVFDADGGRIEGGRLAVRPGGGTIAYVGDISRKNLGFWGNFAFDALKSLRYRSLGIVMNGPLAGEMVTEVRFAGVGQGVGAKSNFILRRLQRLPLVFNIRIKAPFRGLLDTTASFYDPRRLIERNLPELIERQNRPIQPPASETVP